MRWRKLGKIFDSRAYPVEGMCGEFSQSPQALPCDGFVRIYFSTRAVDGGKFRSHVAYVDMTEDLSRVIGVSSRPVIPLGALGTFDEHGIFPLSPLRHGDRILAYTCGWSRRVSVSVETAIGLVESRDGGLTFERFGSGPVMAAALQEPCLVGDAFVRHFEGRFHMWYIFGLRWQLAEGQGEPDRIYKIGHAVSDDGVNWLRAQGRRIVADRLGEDECQALPTVVPIGHRYHMFFCYRHAHDFRSNPARSYRIGHAWSEDLLNWHRDDHVPSIEPGPETWDSEMMCYPHAFECGGRIYLLYNGNAFGRHGFGAAVLE